MGIKNNHQAIFNAEMLRNKREVIESLEDFIAHHKMSDNDEVYNEEQRSIIIDLSERLLKKLIHMDLPDLRKPFYCYEYDLKYDGIILELLRYSEVEVDEEGVISSATIHTERTILKENCPLLSVNEYAALSNVKDITVRQWIRRGKLRTAKKIGREWMIPALSEPPKRGYEPATYSWAQIPEQLLSEYPFLPKSGNITFFQSASDKRVFQAYAFDADSKEKREYQFSAVDRERIELKMISDDAINVELSYGLTMFVPEKRNSSLPCLSKEPLDCPDVEILVRQATTEESWFTTDSLPGSSYYDGAPENYVLPVAWTFYASNVDEDMPYPEENDDFQQIAELSGSLILNREIQNDGWNSVVLCDDLSADLGDIMTVLISSDGPLHFSNGGSDENILYIHELVFTDETLSAQIRDRVIRELPWICKGTLHVFPEILTYYLDNFIDAADREALQRYYENNGFCKIQDTGVLFSYTS